LGVPPESNKENGWPARITILQLATHTAGFEKPGGFGKLIAEPGTKWIYSDGAPNWLAECITLLYQRDIQELLFERVFDPIRITRKDLRWRNNSYRPHEINGIPQREFGAGVHASANALARIGYLYLRNGEWNGSRILSREFIRRATAIAGGSPSTPFSNAISGSKSSRPAATLAVRASREDLESTKRPNRGVPGRPYSSRQSGMSVLAKPLPSPRNG
jgi:CubicO group peptidase (beta-lactamase class C family)